MNHELNILTSPCYGQLKKHKAVIKAWLPWGETWAAWMFDKSHSAGASWPNRVRDPSIRKISFQEKNSLLKESGKKRFYLCFLT